MAGYNAAGSIAEQLGDDRPGAKVYDFAMPWPQPPPDPWSRMAAALERIADALERLAAEHGAQAYDDSPEERAQRESWLARLG